MSIRRNAIILFAGMASLCFSGRAPALDLGDRAPTLGTRDWLNAERSPDFASLRGSVTIVELWGVYCPPCLASLGHLDNAYRTHRDRGLKVFAYHVQSDHGRARGHIREMGYSFPVTFDADASERWSYSNRIPQATVVDADGHVIFQGHPEEATQIALAELDRMEKRIVRERQARLAALRREREAAAPRVVSQVIASHATAPVAERRVRVEPRVVGNRPVREAARPAPSPASAPRRSLSPTAQTSVSGALPIAFARRSAAARPRPRDAEPTRTARPAPSSSIRTVSADLFRETKRDEPATAATKPARSVSAPRPRSVDSLLSERVEKILATPQKKTPARRPAAPASRPRMKGPELLP